MPSGNRSKRKFSEIFKIDPSGERLEVLNKTKIGGVEINRGGSISSGVTIGGVNFFDHKIFKSDLSVEEDENGTIDIKGYFAN